MFCSLNHMKRLVPQDCCLKYMREEEKEKKVGCLEQVLPQLLGHKMGHINLER